MTDDGDVLLTTRQVLERIGLRRTWLKGAVREGRFPRPTSIGNRWLFSRREVHAWVEADRKFRLRSRRRSEKKRLCRPPASGPCYAALRVVTT